MTPLRDAAGEDLLRRGLCIAGIVGGVTNGEGEPGADTESAASDSHRKDGGGSNGRAAGANHRGGRGGNSEAAGQVTREAVNQRVVATQRRMPAGPARSPATGYLLGEEDIGAGLVFVLKGHRRPVGNAEADRFSATAEVDVFATEIGRAHV